MHTVPQTIPDFAREARRAEARARIEDAMANVFKALAATPPEVALPILQSARRGHLSVVS